EAAPWRPGPPGGEGAATGPKAMSTAAPRGGAPDEALVVPVPEPVRSPRLTGASAATPGRRLHRGAVRRHLRDETDPRCRAVVAQLEGYLAGELPRAEEEDIADHLDGCDRCRPLYVELCDGGPRLRTVLVPVLVTMAVIAVALVPGTLRGPRGTAPTSTITAEMADTSSSSPLPAVTAEVPASTGTPASPGGPSTTAAPPAVVPASTSTEPPTAGDPGPTTTAAPGGAGVGEAGPAVPVPSDTSTTEPSSGDEEPDTYEEPSLGFAEQVPRAGASTSVPIDPAPTMVQGIEPYTVEVNGLLSNAPYTPITVTVRKATGAPATDVRVRLAPLGGPALRRALTESRCSDYVPDVVCDLAVVDAAGATPYLSGPAMSSGATSLKVVVTLEDGGVPIGSTTIELPVLGS
ncbi:MAG: hypothetical protein GEV08_22645, partial [Acidimicrobiia bacterium]|nr:hypothetical protein [Acidimicrobiia bacterium]